MNEKARNKNNYQRIDVTRFIIYLKLLINAIKVFNSMLQITKKYFKTVAFEAASLSAAPL